MALPNLAENLGIEKLQAKISSLYGLKKSEDINLLTALFVGYLADNLELIQKPAQTKNSNLCYLTSFPSLPINFPENADIPIYIYGDKVCVCREATEDCGTIIGRFYAFDPNSKQWQWKYLILDNADYTNNSFFSTRVYWETELKPSD